MVQVDESVFSHKVKHHRGRAPQETMWVFGLVDTSTIPATGYMEIVERRDAETLLPIIEKIVRSGTKIFSDEWKAYGLLTRNPNYRHETVNHTLHFVDPKTGVHAQHIESYWNKQKNKIKRMHGCHRSLLKSYLDQFMWLERNMNKRNYYFLQIN